MGGVFGRYISIEKYAVPDARRFVFLTDRAECFKFSREAHYRCGTALDFHQIP